MLKKFWFETNANMMQYIIIIAIVGVIAAVIFPAHNSNITCINNNSNANIGNAIGGGGDKAGGCSDVPIGQVTSVNSTGASGGGTSIDLCSVEPTGPVGSMPAYRNYFSAASDINSLDGGKVEWTVSGGTLNVNTTARTTPGGSGQGIIDSQNYSFNRTISVDMDVNSAAAGILFAADNCQYFGAIVNNTGSVTITNFGNTASFSSLFNKSYPINLNGNTKVNISVKTDSSNNITVTVKDLSGNVLKTVIDNLNTMAGQNLDLSKTEAGIYIAQLGIHSFDNLTLTQN